MKKLLKTILLTAALTIFSTNVFAGEVISPTYQNPAGVSTFRTTATFHDTKYGIFEWHKIDLQGTDTVVATHKYTATTSTWTQTDTYTTEPSVYGAQYYCRIKDLSSDTEGYTNDTNIEWHNNLMNFKDSVDIPSGIPYNVKVTTSPETLRDGLLTDIKWYMQDSTDKYRTLPYRNSLDSQLPILSAGDDNKQFFLRTKAYDNSVRDTRPTRVHVLDPDWSKCYAYQNNANLLDGQKIYGSDIIIHLYYREDMQYDIVPSDQSITFNPIYAKVGKHDYEFTYITKAGLRFNSTVSLTASYFPSENPTEEIVNVRAKYISDGTEVNHSYTTNDFLVEYQFDPEIDDTWYVTNNYMVNPGSPTVVGDNTATISVLHGTQSKDVEVNTIGLVDTTPAKTEGLHVTYKSSYIIEGEELDLDKLEILLVFQDGTVEEIDPSVCDITTKVISGILYVTVNYQGQTAVITIKIQKSKPIALEAKYSGVVPVGMKLDNALLSGKLTFDDGSTLEITANDIDVLPYTINAGINTLDAQNGNLNTEFDVDGVGMDSIAINDPILHVTKDLGALSSAEADVFKAAGLSMTANGTSGVLGTKKLYRNVGGEIREEVINTMNLIPLRIEVEDGKTNIGCSTVLHNSMNYGAYDLYKQPIVKYAYPGIFEDKCYATYNNLRSHDVEKVFVIDENGNVKETYQKGIIAIYDGPNIQPGDKIDPIYLHVVRTYADTDIVVPTDDYTIDPYVIKEGNNLINIHSGEYETVVNIRCKKEAVQYNNDNDDPVVCEIFVTPKHEVFTIGSEVTKNDLEVRFVYTDNTSEISDDYKLVADKIKSGMNRVIVLKDGIAAETYVYGDNNGASDGSHGSDDSISRYEDGSYDMYNSQRNMSLQDITGTNDVILTDYRTGEGTDPNALRSMTDSMQSDTNSALGDNLLYDTDTPDDNIDGLDDGSNNNGKKSFLDMLRDAWEGFLNWLNNVFDWLSQHPLVAALLALVLLALLALIVGTLVAFALGYSSVFAMLATKFNNRMKITTCEILDDILTFTVINIDSDSISYDVTFHRSNEITNTVHGDAIIPLDKTEFSAEIKDVGLDITLIVISVTDAQKRKVTAKFPM